MVQTRSGLTPVKDAGATSARSTGRTQQGSAVDGPAKSSGSKQAADGSTADGEQEERFHKGVAVSMWQNSGDKSSNWSTFIRSKFPFKALPFGGKRYSGTHSIDEACPNTWDRYREDVELAHKAGCTAFRLSIEWARIEPEHGVIDQEAVTRYHEILDCLKEYNMEPNATLHHFVHPQWFDDLGAFEKSENIAIFTEWAVKAVELFGDRIRYWATFNEPTCATFLGWITGMHPPGNILHVASAGHVLHNKLLSHVEAYKAMKRTKHGKRILVGLVHHNITFEATGHWVLSWLAKYAASWMNYWWGYELVHHWMLTGEFKWHVPVCGSWITHQLPEGKPPCDWFGINYYTRSVITWYLKPWCLPGEKMTDMYYPIHSEGLYRSLMQAKQYNIPLYITETGIADRSDANRSYMIDQYMQAMMRAMQDGADVRGIYYWTLVDNFEWNAGYLMEFGLYAWRPDGSVDRKLKPGARMLVRYYKTLPDKLVDVQAAVAKMELETLEEAEEEEREARKLATAGAKKRHPRPLVAAT